jgi:hypothetical protein
MSSNVMVLLENTMLGTLHYRTYPQPIHTFKAEESKRIPVGEEEGERHVGDLPAPILEAEPLMDAFYGDYVH